MNPLASRLRREATRLLPFALLLFLAAAFALPSDPAYALVFYVAVLPLALLAAEPPEDRGVALAGLLILWSGLTLLWGRDDGHRSMHFAIDALMTLAFACVVLPAALRQPASARRLVTVLIWAGAANAVLSIGLSHMLHQAGPRLRGWGVTSNPILGASVMGMALLAALNRALTETRWRAGHLAAVAAMALFILLTGSRGPLAAVGAATIVLCAAGSWRWWALPGLAALAAGWFLLPAGIRRHQAAVLVERGASHRFEIWNRTLQMVARHPVFGNGLAANLDLPDMTFPHDLYLSVLFYSGAVGLLLFGGLLVVVCVRLWRLRAERSIWLAALWINTLVSGLTDLGQITKGPGPLWLIFWLPAGLILSSEKNPRQHRARRRHSW